MGTRVETGTSDIQARRNARIYLVGLGVSLVGNSAMSLVAGIWVKSLTGSSSAAAVVSVCVYAPSLLGPLAGMLADRVRRRPMLVVLNLGSGAAVLPLLLVHSASQVWLIDAVMLGYGLSAVLNGPAESALFTAMLPDHLRRRTNGVRLALQEGGKLVAPLLGAGLYVLLGGGVVAAVDAATFVIAAVALTRLRITEPPPTKETRHWRAELVAGFAHIRRLPEMRSVVIAGAVAMAVSGVASPAVYSLVDGLHRSPSFLGVLTSLLGAGSIIASLTSGPMIRRVGERRLAILGLLNGTLGDVLRAFGTLPTALASSFVFGFALPWTFVAVINLTQRGTPSALQGRVSAAVTLALFAPQPLAQAVGAVVIDRAGYRIIYLVTAAVTIATAAWLAIRPRPAWAARSG
jgi:MFS family permease